MKMFQRKKCEIFQIENIHVKAVYRDVVITIKLGIGLDLTAKISKRNRAYISVDLTKNLCTL